MNQARILAWILVKNLPGSPDCLQESSVEGEGESRRAGTRSLPGRVELVMQLTAQAV